MTRREFLRYPRHHDREPESELQRYLEEAKAVLAAATPPSGEPVDDLVSADFEQCAGSTCTPSAVARTAG